MQNQYEIVIQFSTNRALAAEELNDLLYATSVQVMEPWNHTEEIEASYTTEINKAYVVPSLDGE